MKKIMTAVIGTILLITAASSGSVASSETYQTARYSIELAMSAVEEELESRGREIYPDQALAVFIDGDQYSGTVKMSGGITFVGISDFAALTRNVRCEEIEGQASSFGGEYEIVARDGEEYITSSGRVFWGETENFTEDGRLYVPICAAALSLGMNAEWSQQDFAVYVTRGDSPLICGDTYYGNSDVYWLSKIIEAESRGEPMRGKIAVGNVVLNRVRSEEFPNTVFSVIFDTRFGIQFSPVGDGSINLEPSEASICAAKMCFEGYTVSNSIMYFINASLAEDFWVPENRPYSQTIGGHDFYS